MAIKLIDRNLLDTLSQRADGSPRKRANHNLHESLEDVVQRLCVAAGPGSYFRPSRHEAPDAWEVIVVLRGAFVLLLFDEEATVRERAVLRAGSDRIGVEIPPRTWHTLAALETGSVFFEVKQGPYHPAAEKDFAAWAPPEGSSGAQRFEEWFRTARRGERAPM